MGLIRIYERWCIKKDITSKLEKLKATESIIDINRFKGVCNYYRNYYYHDSEGYSDLVDNAIREFDKWLEDRNLRS